MKWILPSIGLLVFASGCAGMVSSATGRMADNLSTAILDQNDVETVRDATPAYLVMLDALIEGDPRNTNLLLSGADLYGAYAGAFVEDAARRKRLTARSFDYGRRALCEEDPELCDAVHEPYEVFAERIAETDKADVGVLYGFAAAWAGWVEARADDWGAVAEIPKIESAMRRVVQLDETFDDGGAHLYLGVLTNLRPAALGGTPEKGRAHFDRAIELSEGRDLMAKVLYARYYARNVFDQSLHDRLLQEVLDARAEYPGLTLRNTLAQEQARTLLEESSEYF
jgi:hypothetical protein